MISLHQNLAGVDDLLKTWHAESERGRNGEKEFDALSSKVDHLINVNAAEMSGMVTNVANLETGCKQISSSVERNMEQIADLHLQLESEKREKENMLETTMSNLAADLANKAELDQQMESIRSELSQLSNDSQANRLVMSQVLSQGDKHKDVLDEISKLDQKLDKRSSSWTELNERISSQEARVVEVQSGQAETFKILKTHSPTDALEKLKQDLVLTQHELADLRDLKGQIVSLANPVENMERTMKHLSGVVESLEDEINKVQKGKQELRTDLNNEIEQLRKDINDGKSDQEEIIKILDTLRHNEDIGRLQQDLIQTQREVTDLRGLKAQIVSLANPLEKMEGTLKHLGGVVQLVEEEVVRGKEGRQELKEKINQETDLLRKDLSDEIAKLKLDFTADGQKERAEEHENDVLDQVRAIGEDQKSLLSKLAEGEKEAKAVKADQDGLLEKLA